jgi:hypothetical protein
MRKGLDKVHLYRVYDADLCASDCEVVRPSQRMTACGYAAHGEALTGRNRYAIITLYLLNSHPLSGGVFIELALSDYTSESLH